MNQWNNFRGCLIAGVVAVGLLVVPRAALAIPGYCCLATGGCITIYNGDSCANYECVSCGTRPCWDPSVHCNVLSPSDEDTGDEAVSTASQPGADAAVGEANAESRADRTPSAGAVAPASKGAELDDPAVVMDHEAGVCIGDPLKDVDSAGAPFAHPPCANGCTAPPGCRRLSCEPCCWRCQGGLIQCN